MAVGITTTDGKDLDDRYVRTVSGIGPDENGNAQVDVPVTSVQNTTGNVFLRISTNTNPLTATATPANNAVYTYTVPTDINATLTATAGVGYTYNCVSQGSEEPEVCSYSKYGNTRLYVTLNGEYLYPDTTKSKASQTYSTTRFFLKSDVIKVFCYRSYSSDPDSHVFSFRGDPTEIIAEQ